MGKTLKYVKEVFTTLVEWTNKMRFEVHEKKTNFMIVSQKPYSENAYLNIGTYKSENSETLYISC